MNSRTATTATTATTAKKLTKLTNDFARHLDTDYERDADVDSHNHVGIKAFIDHHEERMDWLREPYEEEGQRLDERFSERMKKQGERRNERLTR